MKATKNTLSGGYDQTSTQENIWLTFGFIWDSMTTSRLDYNAIWGDLKY